MIIASGINININKQSERRDFLELQLQPHTSSAATTEKHGLKTVGPTSAAQESLTSSKSRERAVVFPRHRQAIPQQNDVNDVSTMMVPPKKAQESLGVIVET